MNDKLRPIHLQRKAILYIRQSSHYQLTHNHESRRLQYAMEGRLRDMGWKDVEIIDDDLGITASGTATRSGFERMVSSVCLGEVGAVAAREVSRFARNSREWQHLIDVCRVVDAVLVDQETIYNPRQGNDRLLLGMKGSLNEYELDILRMRSLEARYEKADRGELIVAAPAGYVRVGKERLEMSPDRRVQEVVRLVFAKFLELGTVRQTLMWFIEEGILVPVWRKEAEQWATIWKKPTYTAIMSFLRNPTYAGVYAYGKTTVEHSYTDGMLRKRVKTQPQEHWRVRMTDHHAGYISKEDYDRIQSMIEGNAAEAGFGGGAAKRGAALLSGLLRCRRCGRKLTITYTGREREALRYACHRGHLDNGSPKCISFGGTPVDAAVSEEILRVLEPSGLAAAEQAYLAEQEQRNDVVAVFDKELQQARYEAERARRQYDASDPENRLVTGELEARWNMALSRVKTLEDKVQETRAAEVDTVKFQREDFTRLADELPAVWNSSDADIRLKKRILRTLIEDIVVDIDPDRGDLQLLIHWQGGVHTERRVQLRRRGENRCHTPPDVVAAIRDLALICPDKQIALHLSRNGLLTGRGMRWTQQKVTSLRSHREIQVFCRERKVSEGWMTLTDAAAFLEVSTRTLHLAIDRGEIPALHPLEDGPWILKRSDIDSEQGRQLTKRAKSRPGRGAVPLPGQESLF